MASALLEPPQEKGLSDDEFLKGGGRIGLTDEEFLKGGGVIHPSPKPAAIGMGDVRKALPSPPPDTPPVILNSRQKQRLVQQNSLLQNIPALTGPQFDNTSVLNPPTAARFGTSTLTNNPITRGLDKIGGSFIEGVKNVASMPGAIYDAATALPTTPTEHHLSMVPLAAKRLVVDPSVKNIQDWWANRTDTSIPHAITDTIRAVPIVGPVVAGPAGKLLGGDPLGALGEGTAYLGVGKATEAAAETLSNVAKHSMLPEPPPQSLGSRNIVGISGNHAVYADGTTAPVNPVQLRLLRNTYKVKEWTGADILALQKAVAPKQLSPPPPEIEPPISGVPPPLEPSASVPEVQNTVTEVKPVGTASEPQVIQAYHRHRVRSLAALRIIKACTWLLKRTAKRKWRSHHPQSGKSRPQEATR